MGLELRERFGRWRCNHWDLATNLMGDLREREVVGHGPRVSGLNIRYRLHIVAQVTQEADRFRADCGGSSGDSKAPLDGMGGWWLEVGGYRVLFKGWADLSML